MKKIIGLIFGATLAAMIISCAAPGNSEVNNNNVVMNDNLDLRIKKAGVVYDISKAAADNIVTETAHAKVEQNEKGLKFTLKKPEGGWQFTAIYDATTDCHTGAIVFEGYTGLAYTEETVEVIYPLCEPGKLMKFEVQLAQANGDPMIIEMVSIIPENGIGVIDYSNVNYKQWLTLSFDGDTPVSTLKNIIPPQFSGTKLVIEYFYNHPDSQGNIDWANIVWIDNNTYESISCEDSEYTIKHPYRIDFYDSIESIKSRTRQTHNYVFSNLFYTFEVPESSGIEDWRTAAIQSKCAEAIEIQSGYTPMTEKADRLEKNKWYEFVKSYYYINEDNSVKIYEYDFGTQKYSLKSGVFTNEGTINCNFFNINPVKFDDKFICKQASFTKENSTSSGIEGTWKSGGETYYLNSDHTMTGEKNGDAISGTWKYCDTGMVTIKTIYDDGSYSPVYMWYTENELFMGNLITEPKEEEIRDVENKLIN